MMRYFFLCLLLFASLKSTCQKYYLFIGTYTTGGSKGIYVYSFDVATGKAQWISNTTGVVNPSYLAVSENGEFLYACTETATANAGSISAFRINRPNGTLQFLNKELSGGDNPAYVSVHKSGQWVVAGNYSGGSLSVFKTNADGSLQPFQQLIQHAGKSVNVKRQDRAHVHATVFSPKGDYVMVPDLGLDKIMIYPFISRMQNPLQDAAVTFVYNKPGSGPRHFDFHPNKKYGYVIEEMGGSVVAYRYVNGKLFEMQRIAAHEDTATGEFGSADIHVSPDGKFLYASNRGKENNIAIFSIDRKGRLSRVGFQSTLGIQPRNFTIDPSGEFLLAANQKTGNIVIFKRDKNTGLLQYSGQQINVPDPVCLKMIKM